MRSLRVNRRVISDNNPVYVVAEIGGNFKTLREAQCLIDAAVDAGVDAVKLQTYRADTLASKQAMYEMENTGNVSQHDLFREYEVSENDHITIFEYAASRNIDIFSTPSHVSDLEMLEQIGTSVYKIGSDDSSNLSFIRVVSETQKPLIVSTGMCTIFEVDEIVNTIMQTGNKNFAIMHAVTCYPTPYDLANLNVINAFLERYRDIVIGYSDHTIGPQCAIAACVMGALIIERHFTLDKNASGPDHILSSDKEEMKFIVDSIRIIEQAYGSEVKMPTGQETINRKNNRKSIVLEKDIKKGDSLTLGHMTVKRPGYGIEPKRIHDMIGRKVNKDMHKDDILSWDSIDG